MSDYQAALRSRLLAWPAVAALTDRVTWDTSAAAPALPYVVLETISDPRPEHLTGYQAARVTRVQASVVAGSHGQSLALAEAVVAACNAAAGTTAGVHFGRIKAEGPVRLPVEVSGQDKIFGQRVDLLVEHRLAS